MNLEDIIKEVKEVLSEKRLAHSIGTMERAKQLAMLYGEDVNKAMAIGIIHDIAKEMTDEELLDYAKKNNIVVDEIEKINPSLLHGKIAADIVKKKYNFSKEMQDAISYHTMGHPDMNMLAKILFVADKTEETRKKTMQDFDEEVTLAKTDIDKSMVSLLDKSIIYTISKKELVHPDSIITRNFFLMKIKEKDQ